MLRRAGPLAGTAASAPTMKKVMAILTVSAVLLLAANFYVRARSGNVAAGENVAAVPQAGEGTKQESKPQTKAVLPELPKLTWDKMESADYKAYIGNLRKVGFPEELIREIIVADVNKMYAAREEPLRTPPVPHDAPLNVRRRKPTVADVENLMKLREILIEKHELLEQLLGVEVPREIVRTPYSRNYEAAEYAVRQLPGEKQRAALEIYEKEILLDDLNQAHGLRGKEELAAYRRINEERDAALKQILTEEEFESFIMNATPPGSEMQRRVMGMEPTDEEMLAMWKVTHEHWKEQGGVFGRWRADGVSREEILAADERLEKNLQVVLGPERYLDYQLATSGTGQQLRNFAARYGLPHENLAAAFRLQKEIELRDEARSRSVEEARNELVKTLGPDLYEKWNEGRSLKYDFQP